MKVWPLIVSYTKRQSCMAYDNSNYAGHVELNGWICEDGSVFFTEADPVFHYLTGERLEIQTVEYACKQQCPGE